MEVNAEYQEPTRRHSTTPHFLLVTTAYSTYGTVATGHSTYGTVTTAHRTQNTENYTIIYKRIKMALEV
jgi:hypothetical protein